MEELLLILPIPFLILFLGTLHMILFRKRFCVRGLGCIFSIVLLPIIGITAFISYFAALTAACGLENCASANEANIRLWLDHALVIGAIFLLTLFWMLMTPNYEYD